MKDDIEVWVDEADSVMKAVEEMELVDEWAEFDQSMWVNLNFGNKPWLED